MGGYATKQEVEDKEIHSEKRTERKTKRKEKRKSKILEFFWQVRGEKVEVRYQCCSSMYFFCAPESILSFYNFFGEWML